MVQFPQVKTIFSCVSINFTHIGHGNLPVPIKPTVNLSTNADILEINMLVSVVRCGVQGKKQNKQTKQNKIKQIIR